MLEVFSLLIVCWGLASLLPKTASDWTRITQRKGNSQNKIVYFSLIAILTCFAGLRTVMNDTAVYLEKFKSVSDSLSAIKEIDLALGKNPGFECYRIILRSLGITEGSLFLFITAAFVSTSYVAFLRKHAIDFSLSVYLLIASTTYAFTLAAIKQTIAISIGIWAIDAIIRRKKVRFVLLILLASTFHPYILIYFIAPLFVDSVWSAKTIMAVMVVVALGGVFGQLLERLMAITESIGDTYDASFFGGGVNVFRLLFYLVAPVMSLMGRDHIVKQSNRMVNLGVNFSVISMCFMILASFGGANMFGRMANYFDVFNCLALPIALYYGLSRSSIRVVKPIIMLCYAGFYYTYYAKYSGAWDADYYLHISIFELFKMILGG